MRKAHFMGIKHKKATLLLQIYVIYTNSTLHESDDQSRFQKIPAKCTSQFVRE